MFDIFSVTGIRYFVLKIECFFFCKVSVQSDDTYPYWAYCVNQNVDINQHFDLRVLHLACPHLSSFLWERQAGQTGVLQTANKDRVLSIRWAGGMKSCRSVGRSVGGGGGGGESAVLHTDLHSIKLDLVRPWWDVHRLRAFILDVRPCASILLSAASLTGSRWFALSSVSCLRTSI